MDWEKYKIEVKNALDTFQFDKEILSVLRDSIKNNQKIFVGGNGGSAAIAMHYVCDFSKGASQNWLENTNRYKAICLASNISYITAISNDEQYDDVFKQQLINLASPNDILIMISSSGNSPNIIKAVKWANNNGLITIGVSGFSGGKLKQLSKYSAHLTHDRYEVCEDVHHVFGQFLATHLREGTDSEELSKVSIEIEVEKTIEEPTGSIEKGVKEQIVSTDKTVEEQLVNIEKDVEKTKIDKTRIYGKKVDKKESNTTNTVSDAEKTIAPSITSRLAD